MGLKGIIAKINKARDAYIAEQERKAERNLERLKTRTAREEERARLSARRAKAREQADKAKAAAIKAEATRKRAEKELRGEGMIASIIRSLESKPRKRAVKHKARRR